MSEVVSDEERTRDLIDPVRLGQWTDDQGLVGAGHPLETRYISGGASNEIFEICRGEHRMVLRRPPRVVPAGRNETMLREYRVLHALNGTDVAQEADNPKMEAFGGVVLDMAARAGQLAQTTPLGRK